jgi:glyoxylase-like metal-dependent hydrolase (beta-lactamase superfamily II)
MHCGHFTVEVLETGDFALDGGAMFGVVPRALWEKSYHAPDAQNRIPMKAAALLVRGIFDGKERVIVVDTGNGEKFSPKLAAIYNIDTSRFRLLTSLARFGVKPSEVTDVILTHLHFDHAGGATMLSERGELVPTFPNARHYVQRDHLTWAQAPTEKDRASFITENFEPLIANGMLETLDGSGELFPGISLQLFHGHTRALQGVFLQGNDESGKPSETKLFFPADLIPTSAHVPVPYIMAYDNFPMTTLDEKKDILPRLYEEQCLVIFEHDGFTQAARIQAAGRGFARGEGVVITAW